MPLQPKRSSVGTPELVFGARQLYLVRHAEAVGTREGQFIGRSDPPLTPRGRRQAERVAQRMARLPIGQVISSPQRRGLATAQRIARVHRLSVVIRPELAELDFGEWEGRSWRTFAPRERRLHRAWLADPWSVSPPGAESLRSLWFRVGRFWRELRSTQSDGTMVVVGHGGSLRVLLCLALELPRHALTRFIMSPGAISCLGWDSDQAWLIRLNDDGCSL